MFDELCLIDKPIDWTSFDVVAKVRNTYTQLSGKKTKVGHSGTLDPKATGLLILAIGKKTKDLSHLELLDKEYTGEIKLGVVTKSFDTETSEEGFCDVSNLKEQEIIETAHSFLGKQFQLPPMYSATWHKGKRLYDIARSGKEVERKSKPIEVFEFEVLNITLPVISFRIVVSKGAYIRSIANDFGNRLKVGAYLKSLRRTRIGEYTIELADTVQEAIEKIRKRSLDYGNSLPIS